MKNQWGLVLAIAVGLATGCTIVDSQTVDQETVYMSWWGRYDESQGEMRWSASFTAGDGIGTYVRLTGKSEARVNGKAMAEEETIFNSIDYVWGHAYRPVNSPARDYVLEYVDSEGVDHSNTVSIPPRVTVDPVQQPSLSISAAAFDARWRTVEGLTTRDSVGATLSTAGITISATDDFPSGSRGRARFSAEQFKQFTPGQAAHLQICVSRDVTLEQVPARGGSLRISYCSLPKLIEIVP